VTAGGYKTFFVTDGGQDFVRVYSEQVYGIPPEQVVGSTGATQFGTTRTVSRPSAIFAVPARWRRKRNPTSCSSSPDNLGNGELGVYGGGAPTSRIDGLASEGIRLLNFNVEAQCTREGRNRAS
jgi:hypothetical protein